MNKTLEKIITQSAIESTQMEYVPTVTISLSELEMLYQEMLAAPTDGESLDLVFDWLQLKGVPKEYNGN